MNGGRIKIPMDVIPPATHLPPSRNLDVDALGVPRRENDRVRSVRPAPTTIRGAVHDEERECVRGGGYWLSGRQRTLVFQRGEGRLSC